MKMAVEQNNQLNISGKAASMLYSHRHQNPLLDFIAAWSNWQLVGFITRRLQVRVLPPLLSRPGRHLPLPPCSLVLSSVRLYNFAGLRLSRFFLSLRSQPCISRESAKAAHNSQSERPGRINRGRPYGSKMQAWQPGETGIYGRGGIAKGIHAGFIFRYVAHARIF